MRSVRQYNILIVIEWILLTVSKIENCRKQRNDLNLKKEELQENCVVFFFHFSKNWVTIIETKHSGKKWQKVKTFLRKMYQCYTHLYLYFSFILQNRKKMLYNFTYKFYRYTVFPDKRKIKCPCQMVKRKKIIPSLCTICFAKGHRLRRTFFFTEYRFLFSILNVDPRNPPNTLLYTFKSTQKFLYIHTSCESPNYNFPLAGRKLEWLCFVFYERWNRNETINGKNVFEVFVVWMLIFHFRKISNEFVCFLQRVKA